MDVIKFIDNLQIGVSEGSVSVESAVRQIAGLIHTHFPLFGLQKCNEDERSTIILEFISTGDKIFQRYDADQGFFHSYLQSTIRWLQQDQCKKTAVSIVREKVNYYQSIDDYRDNEKTHDFTLVIENGLSVPYAYEPAIPEKFTQKLLLKDYMARRNVSENGKRNIILAFKACYDITDYEIQLICRENNLDENNFYVLIQEAKNSLDEKIERRNQMLRSRNAAYYNHVRFSPDVTEYEISTTLQKKSYNTKYEINTDRWKEKNYELKNGKYHLSPTNKVLAEILGISVRQISYYLQQAKEQYTSRSTTA